MQPETPEIMLLCDFDQRQGDVMRDISAGKLREGGKLIGNPGRTDGHSGNALLLDGKADAVDFGSCREVFDAPPLTDVPAGSVEFWFSPTEDIDGKAALSVLVDSSQSPQIRLSATGELEAAYVANEWKGGNTCVLKSGITQWKAGTWYHVHFSWNAKGHFLSVDKTPVASDELGDGLLVGTKNVTTGANYSGDWSQHFAGKIDDLKITRTRKPITDVAYEKLPSGVVRETRQCRGSLTGHVVNYIVHYPAKGKRMPVFLHQYGWETERTAKVNERVAAYGIFSILVQMDDTYCGYALQDYKDAIDDAFRHYADRIDSGNVAIAGASAGGAVVYAMSVRFPYLFDLALPIFGISDFGYDNEESWFALVEKNSPDWGPSRVGMPNAIGERAMYRETRYLVRNAIFAAKNNPYAHFEILHDVSDGVKKPGVQVEMSRRYVAELKRLGYTNFRYTESPTKDDRFPSGDQEVSYGHSFYSVDQGELARFERYVVKPCLLNATWKRPPFRKMGELFIPAFLEVPFFRFDLGNLWNNCDEAADVTYDVSSPDKYRFEIVPRTEITTGTLRLFQLKPHTQYGVTCQKGEAKHVTTDASGTLLFNLPAAAKGAKLLVECVRK